MRSLILTILVFLSFPVLYVSAQDPYIQTDKHASRVNASSIKSLHDQLVKGLNDDEHKVRAFYYWIANNIHYDVAEMKRSLRKPSKQEPAQVLLSRKAVCQGYSALFSELCTMSGIPSHLVSGYTRIAGNISYEGHTWNVVKVHGKWKHIDVTWAGGGLNDRMVYVKEFSNKYFFPEAEQFIEDHLPFDPVFQLLNFPYSPEQFKTQHPPAQILYQNYFNYNDTLTGWSLLPEVEKDLVSAERAFRFYPGDPLVNDFRNYALVNAGNIELEKANGMLAKLYPPKGMSSVYKSTSERKPVLDSIETCFNKADLLYGKIIPLTPADKHLKEENEKVLQYNRNIIRSERR